VSTVPAAPPSVVVFDLGGVIADWNPRYLFASIISETRDLDWFLDNVCNQKFFLALDLAKDSREAAKPHMALFPDHAHHLRTYVERFAETVRGEIAPMGDLVRRLHAAGVAMHGLTNWAADTFAATRARLPVLELLRHIVVSGEEGIIKPDPRIFALVCARGGFSAADAVFIDDSLKNVEGARAFGLRAIHHRTPEETIAALRAMGLPA
jgi:2-haloacid dehalogenase